MITKELYYTHKRNRGSKWATAEVFAIIGGKLEYIATARYQPGASRGVRGEVIDAAAISSKLGDVSKATVREIEPGI